jgi:hypothetical protein
MEISEIISGEFRELFKSLLKLSRDASHHSGNEKDEEKSGD